MSQPWRPVYDTYHQPGTINQSAFLRHKMDSELDRPGDVNALVSAANRWSLQEPTFGYPPDSTAHASTSWNRGNIQRNVDRAADQQFNYMYGPVQGRLGYGGIKVRKHKTRKHKTRKHKSRKH